MPGLVRRLVRCLTAAVVVAGTTTGLAVAAHAADTVVTVTDGGAPGWVRFDSAGNAVDAHDGEIKQFSYVGTTKVGSKYYLYGTGYGCGYVRLHGYGGDTRPVTPFCGFTVYESTDLRHWTYDGKLFDPSTTTPTNWQRICNSATLSCYRPHMLYDYAAGRYVLWVNTYDLDANKVQHGYHVLTSTSPRGPFKERTDANGHAVLPTLEYPTGGDFDVFQDSDAARTGYIAYTVRYDPLHPAGGFSYRVVVEKLSANYLTGTGAATDLATRHTEAPSLFRRGNDYYLTMSDPYCAYCAGTGTTYLRAHTPLGSWHGPTGYGSASLDAMVLEGRGALFQGRDLSRQAQQRLANLRDYDLAFRVKPQPDFTTHSTHRARAGWMFRAADVDNGYLWLQSNQPRGKAPATLYKQKILHGRVVATTAVAVKRPFRTDTWNRIRTHVVGARIQTFVNGTLVDTTIDHRFRKGYAGLREPTDDAAWYDDVRLTSPAKRGVTPRRYLSESFQDGSLRAFGSLDRVRRHGYEISGNSCGGQPDDVAMLTATRTSSNRSGFEYLYQADRWDNADQNEGQATQYWEPLRFAADGSIRPLTCRSVYTLGLSAASPSSSPTGGFDQALDGFTAVQDLTSGHARGERFLVTKAMSLVGAKVTVFQTDDPAENAVNAPLSLAVYDVDDRGQPTGDPLTQATVAASDVSWAPTVVTVPLAALLTPNPDGSAHRYVFVLSTTSTSGFYGVVRNDGTAFDAVPAADGMVQVTAAEGSLQWQAEPRRDLRIVPVTSG